MKDPNGDLAFRTLFVSFSMILLGIFIFLNSFATPDHQRSASAIASLEQSFASDFDVRDNPSLDTQDLLPSDIRQLFPEKSQVETIGAIEAMIKGGRLSAESKKDGFYIYVPTIELFVANDDQVRAEFLPIVKAIAEYSKSSELACEVRVHQKTVDGKVDLRSLDDATRHAQALYRLFIDFGASADDVDGLAQQSKLGSSSTSSASKVQFRIYRKDSRGDA
jgi:hypothetical protein